MYAIYGNIYHQYTRNVGIYTIHGSYGIVIPRNLGRSPEQIPPKKSQDAHHFGLWRLDQFGALRSVEREPHAGAGR